MGLTKGGDQGGQAKGEVTAVVPARSQAVVANELAASPRRPFAYLKFHKVMVKDEEGGRERGREARVGLLL
jgi:hypothetical protein